MMDLTEAQKNVMLQIGDSESDCEAIPKEVLEQLIELNLVWRTDNRMDFTDAGEALFDELISQ